MPPLTHLIPAVAAFTGIAVAATLAFGTLTPVWYSNAIGVVTLVLHPARSWGWFVLPMGIADALVIQFAGHGPPLPLALADALEIVLTATGIRATGGIRMPVFAGGQMARVMLFCLLVPVVSAGLAAASLALTEAVVLREAWRSSYSANALGLVIACPFLLSWADAEVRQQAYARLGTRGALALAAGALLAAYLVQSDLHETLLFLVFPLVFALTWVFGLPGATVGMVSVMFAVLVATLNGHGGIAHVFAAETLTVQMEAAQVYLAAVLLSSLPLTVLRAQQNQLTESVRRAGEARSEFLAAMSHEIRTPMTGVLGMVDLLGTEPLTARQQRYLDALRTSGRHLLSVINDILDFTRIETGRLELEEVDFTLLDVMEAVRSLMHPLAVERGLALEVRDELPADLVLCGDPLRLRQVLLNLVGNAIKFTERGSVVVRATHRREPDGRLRLAFEVQDTGVGIAPEKIDQLFAPFTQADRSTSRQYGGSGLGLAISRRLVEAMGGTIAVHSQPGQGSVFRFDVLLREGDPAHLRPGRDAAAAPVPPRRILVAEDVEINRELLRTALERAGHSLRFARHGGEALAFVQEEAFDLVLMDVQMPVLDGVEATRRIRQLPPPAGRIPIVGLTANVMARERERYLAAGMDECLSKPIDWPALHAAIARLGARQGEQRDVPPPSAPPAPAAPAPTATALIDEEALGAIRRMTDPAQLAGLLQLAFAGYEEAWTAMQQAGADAAILQQQAHRVKGSAGTLGLEAIRALASGIEEAGLRGEDARDLLPPLRAAIDGSRALLRRRGLLDEAEGRAHEPHRRAMRE